MINKLCEFCEKRFEAKTNKAKCCSLNCYREKYRRNNYKQILFKSKLRQRENRTKNPEYFRALWKQQREKYKIYYSNYGKIYQENLRQEENKRRKKLGLPLIGKGYRSEMELFVYISSLFPSETIIRHDRSTLKLFSDIRRNPELDVYLPNRKLAFEFDGEWHYKFHPYFHKTFDEFIERQKFHKLKREMCKELGIILITVRESEKLSESLVIKKLQERGIDCIQKTLKQSWREKQCTI